jgi:hypothetical protein
MAFPFRKYPRIVTAALGLTLFSCSLPFFAKTEGEGGTEKGSLIPARLSGVLELAPGCKPGYYQIRLMGQSGASQTQVEAQSDQNGHFSITAPAGTYLVQVTRGECGVKQSIHLEGNTEHMISLSVGETRALEKADLSPGRLPASVLIEPKR